VSEDSTTGRLIIVDDEPVILDLLASVFAESPWEVVACSTGVDAVNAMDEGGVDVLLTDKNLPDLGGIELIEHARTVQPDAECLIITGYPSIDTAVAAMHLEVFDYIIKPPKDIFDVRRKVQQAFEKQAVIRENRDLTEDLKTKNTELGRTLQKMRELQAELIQSEKLAGIGTLAAGIAHEISSPLFGIMGLAEAIREEDDLSLVRGYAAEIVEYTRSIRDVVRDLSGYSRSADREYLTTVELAQVIEDAVRLVTRSLKFGEDRVELSLEEGLYMQARTSEVQQVFVNLVKNAVEAVLEGDSLATGKVWVAAGSGPSHIWASVQDEGPGIPEDRHAMIFDPFYTTKAPGRGTGLGLNIVYRIVTKYRGNVSVESAPGEGSTFHVRFPTQSREV
jgi:C4-dicarboxylate-specific signal transduction histidine kinase